MGLSNILTRLFAKKIPESQEPERIGREELPRWVDQQRADNKQAEEEELAALHERITALNQALDEHIKLLEEIDVKERKADDRSKKIVAANLRQYLSQVRAFQDKLEELAATDLGAFLEELNSLLEDHFKKTHSNHEKATYLVGEVVDLRRLITAFGKDAMEVLERSKALIHRKSALQEVHGSLQEHAQLAAAIQEQEQNKKGHEKQLGLLEAQEEKLKDRLKQRTEGEEHQKNKRLQDQIKVARSEQKNIIGQLRERIDFKALASELHSNQKRMQAVQEHRSDLAGAISKDDGELLLELLQTAGMKDDKVRTLIKGYQDSRASVAEKQEALTDVTKPIRDQRKQLHREQAKEREEIAHSKKVMTKLREQQAEIEQRIREELEQVQVRLQGMKNPPSRKDTTQV